MTLPQDLYMTQRFVYCSQNWMNMQAWCLLEGLAHTGAAQPLCPSAVAPGLPETQVYMVSCMKLCTRWQVLFIHSVLDWSGPHSKGFAWLLSAHSFALHVYCKCV